MDLSSRVINVPITHNGDSRLRINAKPFGQEYTAHPAVSKIVSKRDTSRVRFGKLPKANDAEFLNSIGVAAGIPMMMTRQRLEKTVSVFTELVPELARNTPNIDSNIKPL